MRRVLVAGCRVHAGMGQGSAIDVPRWPCPEWTGCGVEPRKLLLVVSNSSWFNSRWSAATDLELLF
jgi:hypothetical protein